MYVNRSEALKLKIIALPRITLYIAFMILKLYYQSRLAHNMGR
jgi:hypothetical protein